MYTYTNKKAMVLLLAFFILYLFGNGSIAITDPVESNYTEAASEMLRAGDYISPRIYGNYWFDKPALFMWELILAFSLFGETDFAARFFPAVFGVLGLFLTYFFAKRLYDIKTAVFSVIILGTSFLYWLVAKTVITDMTLFVFFDAVLVFFYLGWKEKKASFYFLSFLFSALAVLTKGPIGLLLPGLVLVVFLACKRDWQGFLSMPWLRGFLLFGLVVSLWYGPMYARHGDTFVELFLGVHNVLRATVSEHPMWDVWWYYTAIFILGFFPWSLVAFKALFENLRAKGKRIFHGLSDEEQFLLLWFFLIQIFYQNMATKYTTYTLPMLLPISILIARYLSGSDFFTRRWHLILPVLFTFYLLLTQLVVVPLTNIGGFSGKPFAKVLNTRMQDEDLLVSYGVYSAGTVYYTKHTMYNLETRATLGEISPDGTSWAALNVMPYMAIEDLPRDRDIYLMLKKKKEKPLFPPGLNQAEWERLSVLPSEAGMWLYYRKKE